jgi:predicted SAM-dependent methyltransferase
MSCEEVKKSLKLHLGCGQRYLPGFFHIDISKKAGAHIDLACDIRTLDSIESDSVDDIYASHVLEHFPRKEIPSILREWNRVLKPGGTIHIAVPNFDACVRRYEETQGELSELLGLLCGGQRDEYDFHHVIFNEAILKSLMQQCGFSQIQKYNWQEYLPTGFDDYSRCYLPHMDFISGTLMSLNMQAVKSAPADINSSTSTNLSTSALQKAFLMTKN